MATSCILSNEPPDSPYGSEVVLRLFPEVDGPTCWLSRAGKEVPIKSLDDGSVREILEKLYQLAVVKQETAAGLYEGFKGPYFQKIAALYREMSWKDFADKIFFDLEFEAAQRRLGWIPLPVSANRKVNLMQHGALERYLVGALRDSINAHGPITKDSAPSAAKRLVGSIKTYNHDRSQL